MNQSQTFQSQDKSIGKNTRSAPREFHFVDTTNTQYRRNARSYLVTERLRQLRWRNNTSKTKKTPEAQIIQRSPNIHAASTKGQRKQRHYEQRFRLSELESPKKDTSERHMECIPRFAICEGLDPFQTLPIASSLEMRQLVDHCMLISLSGES
ncbi:hypothetical protein N7488_001014 [Penicillium malachiteum]|nr:hypothetical protein N7488_001014 [Penicillium malachiteum]